MGNCNPSPNSHFWKELLFLFLADFCLGIRKHVRKKKEWMVSREKKVTCNPFYSLRCRIHTLPILVLGFRALHSQNIGGHLLNMTCASWLSSTDLLKFKLGLKMQLSSKMGV
uniref:Uncharacterized protein n=1 Tax=Micrurus surinamensis TaxID=129470 RepID=A0A2D4PQ14_MICSU